MAHNKGEITMDKRDMMKGFAIGALLGVLSILTGCGGVPVKEALPDSVWLQATGSGTVVIGVDTYPPVTLEHEGDVEVFWAIDSWPPKIVSSDADQCARIEWLFLEHESDGCNE